MKVDGPDARKVKESKEQTRIFLRKLGDEAKASPEAKAKIDKAKARLEKIRAELRTKQKELAEAEHDLFKLSSDTGDFLIHGPGVVELHGKPLTIEKRIVARSRGSSASSRHRDRRSEAAPALALVSPRSATRTTSGSRRWRRSWPSCSRRSRA